MDDNISKLCNLLGHEWTIDDDDMLFAGKYICCSVCLVFYVVSSDSKYVYYSSDSRITRNSFPIEDLSPDIKKVMVDFGILDKGGVPNRG